MLACILCTPVQPNGLRKFVKIKILPLQRQFPMTFLFPLYTSIMLHKSLNIRSRDRRMGNMPHIIRRWMDEVGCEDLKSLLSCTLENIITGIQPIKKDVLHYYGSVYKRLLHENSQGNIQHFIDIHKWKIIKTFYFYFLHAIRVSFIPILRVQGDSSCVSFLPLCSKLSQTQ